MRLSWHKILTLYLLVSFSGIYCFFHSFEKSLNSRLVTRLQRKSSRSTWISMVEPGSPLLPMQLVKSWWLVFALWMAATMKDHYIWRSLYCTGFCAISRSRATVRSKWMFHTASERAWGHLAGSSSASRSSQLRLSNKNSSRVNNSLGANWNWSNTFRNCQIVPARFLAKARRACRSRHLRRLQTARSTFLRFLDWR